MSSPEMRLRPARADDLDAIVAIADASFEHPWTRGAHAADLDRDDRRWVVAEHGDEVVGFLGLWLIGDDLAEILSVAVAPQHRRGGLGRRLTETALATARAAGCARVGLEVRADNAGALALYAGLGFAQVGRRPGYYLGGQDALLLDADLTVEALACS